ncbi:hypothetical protein ACFWTE_22700 [Nocardiopsis sp. NPDC058631]|uniref:hypothetical protein n=1 Tax=Nocardiopsis sp. NPDC058631 TaxID=3346566 RepID=UPI0036679C78
MTHPPSPHFQPRHEPPTGQGSSPFPEDGSPFGGRTGRPSFAPPEPPKRGMSAADRIGALVLGCVIVALVALVGVAIAVLLPV